MSSTVKGSGRGVRGLDEAADALPGRGLGLTGVGDPLAEAMASLEVAGVALERGERELLAALTAREPETAAVVASLLDRARTVQVGAGLSSAGHVLVLRIPAIDTEPCALLSLALSSAALSDALGGGLLDDAQYGCEGGAGYCLYLDEDRRDKNLPPNRRAVQLAERLGWGGSAERVDVRGDALVLGTDDFRNDADVPVAVVTAARRAGLLRGVNGGSQ